MTSKEYTKQWRINNPEKVLEYRKKYKLENPDKLREWKLKHLYGITLEKYNQILYNQSGRCLICGVHHIELNKNLTVDHNHETGEVRGLLCMHCNLMLGYAKEDLKILKKAIEYLEK